MELPEVRPSTLAWCFIGTFVASYDALCPKGETLSEGVGDVLERPVGKYLALGGIALTAAHLARILPEQIDPFHQALKWKHHGTRPE